MRVDIHGPFQVYKVFSAASADLIEEKINSWLYAYNNVLDPKDTQVVVSYSGGTYVATIRCTALNKKSLTDMKYWPGPIPPASATDGGFKYDPAMYKEPSL